MVLPEYSSSVTVSSITAVVAGSSSLRSSSGASISTPKAAIVLPSIGPNNNEVSSMSIKSGASGLVMTEGVACYAPII
jgi:hypothetical protein